MDLTAQLTAPAIQTNVLLMDTHTVKWDGQVPTVTRMSMNALVNPSAATVTVQTLLVVSTVPVPPLCMV